MGSRDKLVECQGVTKHFPIKGFFKEMGRVHAVEKVSLSIARGETFGLVGESGCGKTTLARMILRLIPPTSGQIYFEGRNLFALKKEELKKFRRETAMVFQDPYSSLNPRMIIADVVGEPLSIHGIAHGQDRDEMVQELLGKVGLKAEHLYRYPHEFSGGQRQRIAIARALAADPKFIVLDEPTSALDVSVQAMILNMLNHLKDEFNFTYLFISHNLAVVHHMSNKVAVMYLGKIVELADRDGIYRNPKHPYTFQLMEAIPLPNPEARKVKVLIKGDIPSPMNIPSGCRFHPRCPYAKKKCEKEEPELTERDGHLVACHYDIEF